jgi:ABC-2 type transport system permease protein
MEYRLDFLVGLAGAFCLHLSGVALILIILRAVDKLAGWPLGMYLLTYGLALIPRGLAGCFADGTWRLGDLVRKGGLDQLLMRPLNPLLQLLTMSVNPAAIGDVMVGVGLVVAALLAGAFPVSAWTVPAILFTVACGTIISICINLLSNSTVFWAPAAASDSANLIGITAELAKYPTILYDWPVRFVVTFIVPFAFVGYFPALLTSGRGSSGLANAIGILAATAIAVAIAVAVWVRGLRRYESAG